MPCAWEGVYNDGAHTLRGSRWEARVTFTATMGVPVISTDAQILHSPQPSEVKEIP